MFVRDASVIIDRLGSGQANHRVRERKIVSRGLFLRPAGLDVKRRKRHPVRTVLKDRSKEQRVPVGDRCRIGLGLESDGQTTVDAFHDQAVDPQRTGAGLGRRAQR